MRRDTHKVWISSACPVVVDFIAVRQTTTNPLVFIIRRVYTFTLVAGVATNATGSPTQVLKHGDATMDGVLTVIGAGATVKPQVTGLGVTTFDWRVNVKVKTLSSI